MKRGPGASRLVATAAALAGLAFGCGYSAGPLTRRVERRIHLPLFENRTYYRDLEIELTRQVEKELAARPGISISPYQGADIVLAGTIVDFEQRVLSEDSQDRVRESSVLARVRIEVRDARTGGVRRAYEVRDRAEFQTESGETLASATSEAFFDLARRIVDGLEDDFPHATARPKADETGADSGK